jgi:hypothetical protein
LWSGTSALDIARDIVLLRCNAPLLLTEVPGIFLINLDAAREIWAAARRKYRGAAPLI